MQMWQSRGAGVLRLRETVRFTHRLAPLRMTTCARRLVFTHRLASTQDDTLCKAFLRMTDWTIWLLQAEAFGHEALQAGFVEQVVG